MEFQKLSVTSDLATKKSRYEQQKIDMLTRGIKRETDSVLDVDLLSQRRLSPNSQDTMPTMTNPMATSSAQQSSYDSETDKDSAIDITSNDQFAYVAAGTGHVGEPMSTQLGIVNRDSTIPEYSDVVHSDGSEVFLSDRDEIALALRKRPRASVPELSSHLKRRKMHPRAVSYGIIETPQHLPFTVDVPGNYNERHAFHFFKSRTVQDILGQQDAHLWEQLFLAASHTEPVVKHAVIAVASLHKSLEYDAENKSVVKIEGDRNMRAFSLRHYLKAVNLLSTRTSASTMSPDVMLTVCILFVCFEEFRGDFTASLVHLKGGIELLRQWKQAVNRKGDLRGANKSLAVLLDRLNSILTRLDVQEATFMDQDPNKIKILQSCHEQDQPEVPSVFATLLEARESLDTLMKWMYFRLENTPRTGKLALETELEQMFNDWLRALRPYFVDRKPQVNPSEVAAICLLRIYYLLSTVIYRTYYAVDEMVFDLYTEQFKTIVDLAGKVLLSNDGQNSQYKLIFSFDFGITPPLSLTAVRCRDPTIRRQALTLLKSTRSKQGPFGSSELVAKCEECIMMVEESGLGTVRSCADVPGNKRVRKVGANVETEMGTIKLAYIHYPYDQKAERGTIYLSAS